jgi:predicted TIM-barrel fold metal-dependent hydrolase
MLDTSDAFDSVIRGHGLSYDRVAQPLDPLILPEGTVVVSADNHWSVTDDIFYKRFPDHLKDRAPRVRVDDRGVHNWYIEGKPLIPPDMLGVFEAFENVPGCIAIDARVRDMDIMGVAKEINFGNAIGAGLTHPDLEAREWVFRTYNEHLAEMGAKAPGRFHGVGTINYWDRNKTRASIAEVKALGLKTYILPQNPKGEGGALLDYCSPEMAYLWEAVEDAGLPICFHVGEFFKGGPGGLGISSMVSFGPFRKTLGELIFGGILDRHPSLQVVFAEAEINWIPGALQSASMVYENYTALIEPKIRHHPRHYWRNNCYATFIHDPVGLRLLDIIGADRVMWSSDYPHVEGNFGYTRETIKAVLDAVTPDEARMILGGTAIRVFDL